MTLFWSLAAMMLAVALLFTLPVIMRSKYLAANEEDAINVELIRTQLDELKADLAAGRLDEAQYEAARADLERELLADLSGESAGNGAQKVRGGRWALLLLAILIPGMTLGLYQLIGTKQIIPLLAGGAPVPPRQAAAGPTEGHSLEEMVAKLAARLQEQPDNAEGWVMLARSYTSLRRFGDAAVAYERAHQLLGNNAALLADYADALVMANNMQFTDQAGGLLMQALEMEPANVKALWLAGLWKSQQGDNAAAVGYWERAAELLPPGGEDAVVIAGQIRQARAQLKPGEVAKAPPVPQDTAPADDSAAGKSVDVGVRLDPALADAAAPTDTVFIFARAVSGPRMPLAIVRKQVSDLPLIVTLDDTTAMAPAMKLSNFDQVAIGARVSKSGNAMPQSGDLQGLVAPVTPGAGLTVELTIDSRIP